MTEGSLLASGAANCPIGWRHIKGQCEDMILHLHMAYNSLLAGGSHPFRVMLSFGQCL